MQLACKCIGLHGLLLPPPCQFARFFISTPTANVWNVTTKPSWMSKHRSDEERRGNGRKNCSFCFPWHAISILFPHLSKSYLKHINLIFLGLDGPLRITSRHGTVTVALERKDGNDNSALFAYSLSFECWLKRRWKKNVLNVALPLAKENSVYWGNWSCLRWLFHQRKCNTSISSPLSSF